MWQVFFKELKELLRDKKTLFFIIALPMIVFPIIFGLAGFVASKAVIDEQQKVLNYAIVNGDVTPEFTEALFYSRDFKVHELTFANSDEMIAAVREEKVDLVIVIDENYQQALAAGEQSKWQLYYNDSSQINAVMSKVRGVFDKYSKKVQQAKFAELGVEESKIPNLIEPIALEKVDTADEKENWGEKLGGFIPYLLIPLCLTGAMYPAIDIGAGEKERGTLETLLLTPVSRFNIVMGKFLTITVSGILTALITVGSLLLWSKVVSAITGAEVIKEALATFTLADMSLILLLLLPLAFIFAAVLLAISIYARSFKEAQNYMGPISMMIFVPVMMAMLPGIELNWKWASVPIANVALAIKEILKGTIDYAMLAVIFGSSVVFALIAMAACVYWFNQEKVLFR